MTQLERLAKPFPRKYVKPPAKGKFGSYIDHEIINQALLLIVGAFSFEIRQTFLNPDGLLDGCTAALTCEIDGRTVTIEEAGDCEFPENSKTQGDRLKKCASDALKRCAMRLGCGIEVWTGDDDYFLYEQLKTQTKGDQPLISQNKVQGLVARAHALRADNVDVDGKQISWHLPDIAASDEKQLGLWDEMLHELEAELTKPFVEETAGV